MSVLSVSPPYPVFFGTDGEPLEGGQIYLGTVGLNPLITANQVAVYSDAALTTPIAQPVRTIAGFAVNNSGSPVRLYVGLDDCSILVLDRNGRLVHYASSNKTKLGLIDLSTEVTGTLLSTFIKYDKTGAENSAGVTPLSYSYLPYHAPRYGMVFDGVTDDRTAFMNLVKAALGDLTPDNLHVYASRVMELQTPYPTPHPSYAYMSDGVEMDPSFLTLDGQGNILNFESKVVGALSALKLSVKLNASPGIQLLVTGTRGVRNVALIMPSYDVNVVAVGIDLADFVGVAGSYQAFAVNLENVTVLGGAIALQLGNGVYCSEITNFRTASAGSNKLGVSVRSNAGRLDVEPDHFTGGFIAGGLRAFSYASGHAIVMNMTMDGCKSYALMSGTGRLHFIGGYTEHVGEDNSLIYWQCTDPNGQIIVDSRAIGFRQDTAVRTLDFGSCTAGLMVFRNCLFQGNGFTPYTGGDGFLITGAGRVAASGNRFEGFPWAPLMHRSLQWLAYPDINNANALAGMTLSNSAAFNPVRQVGISGRDAIKFQINAGAAMNSYSRLVFTKTALVPGKRISVVGSVFTAGSLAGSNVRFDTSITYKDVAGNVIVSYNDILINNVDVAVWTTLGTDGSLVPPGCWSVEIQIQSVATAVVVGNTLVYMSPLGIGYADGE